MLRVGRTDITRASGFALKEYHLKMKTDAGRLRERSDLFRLSVEVVVNNDRVSYVWEKILWRRF